MKALAPYLKACAAVITGGLAVAYVALEDSTITPQEAVGIAQGALAAGAVVWGVPNFPKNKHVADG